MYKKSFHNNRFLLQSTILSLNLSNAITFFLLQVIYLKTIFISVQWLHRRKFCHSFQIWSALKHVSLANPVISTVLYVCQTLRDLFIWRRKRWQTMQFVSTSENWSTLQFFYWSVCFKFRIGLEEVINIQNRVTSAKHFVFLICISWIIELIPKTK